MVVAVDGGVGVDLSDNMSRDGLFGRVIGRPVEEAEGEMGGEHFVLHAGQFLFDDNHLRTGE